MTLKDRDDIKERKKTWCINKTSRSNLNVELVTGEAFRFDGDDEVRIQGTAQKKVDGGQSLRA